MGFVGGVILIWIFFGSEICDALEAYAESKRKEKDE